MNVLVALSGGVDSSVTAHLLQQQGHTVFAATLKTFCYANIQGGPKSCCGLEGIESARAVAARLGIPHTVFDVSERFKTAVIDDFIQEYAAGRTPNPCVLCNATVKIPDLLTKARQLGCEAIATGHYARIVAAQGEFSLHRGTDRAKDQSYFLWALPREVLPHFLLPIGHLTKPEVRDIARQIGLESAEKPESQEICFVPDGDYFHFLKQLLPPGHPGFISGILQDRLGNRLGTHQGYLQFTIGQRKGLGGGHGKRLFVTGIHPESRRVTVGEEPETYHSRLRVSDLNLLAAAEVFQQTGVSVQIRHRAQPEGVTLASQAGGVWEFSLKKPVRAVTPGQSAVFYLEDRLLGGGRISSL